MGGATKATSFNLFKNLKDDSKWYHLYIWMKCQLTSSQSLESKHIHFSSFLRVHNLPFCCPTRGVGRREEESRLRFYYFLFFFFTFCRFCFLRGTHVILYYFFWSSLAWTEYFITIFFLIIFLICLLFFIAIFSPRFRFWFFICLFRIVYLFCITFFFVIFDNFWFGIFNFWLFDFSLSCRVGSKK